MRPMGRKPVRFPRKVDCHPPKGRVNWWEGEIDTANKAAERDKAKKEIEQALVDETPNEKVTGSPELSASPCGLPGYASGDKHE